MTHSHDAAHRFSLRVYYEDTDAGGIVYYANYLRFFERARTEWLRIAGIDHTELKRRYGLIFAVRSCDIDYLAPARLDDLLEVVTEIRHLGASRLDMTQFIRHEEKTLTTADVTVVAIGLDGRPVRIPDDLRRIIAPLISSPAAEKKI
ncbi:MAG: tol-pal system-associated acyl-CoA thioesterase [Alphaproteobacteria bacterium]